MVNIALVVEGQADQEALPLLVRRIAQEEFSDYTLVVGTPVRLSRGRFLMRDHVSRAARLALLKVPEPSGVLVVFDSDEECPVELAAGCTELLGGVELASIVVAHHEFEAWFLAALESLRDKRGIRPDAVFEGDPDEIRKPKALLNDMMGGRRYVEVADQPALASLMSIEMAQRSRSFRKLRKEIERLLLADGQ